MKKKYIYIYIHSSLRYILSIWYEEYDTMAMLRIWDQNTGNCRGPYSIGLLGRSARAPKVPMTMVNMLGVGQNCRCHGCYAASPGGLCRKTHLKRHKKNPCSPECHYGISSQNHSSAVREPYFHDGTLPDPMGAMSPGSEP